MSEKPSLYYSSDDDIDTPLNGGPRRVEGGGCACRSCYLLRVIAGVAAGLVVMLSLVLFYISHREPSEMECAARTSTYSPLIDAVEYTQYNYNNSFWHPSPYRGPPTNELEGNWERLWNHDLVAVPDDKFHLLNVSDDRIYMRAPPEKGGGYGAYLEVFHHLHCLSLVRQFTWYSYYKEHPDRVKTPFDLTDDEEGLRTHVDHCIETVRLALMCQSDVTPYLLYYDKPGDEIAHADFNANHKCRNFERIRDEAVQRTVMQRWPGGNRKWTQGEDTLS